MFRQAFLLAIAAFTGLGSSAQTLPDTPGDPQTYPIVSTPTRLGQSLQDVPASVTILRAETFARYGITNIVDALRLVPGMEITQPSGNDFRINYHGTNLLTPRRMNVLVDGVSVYQPAFARVDWANLPVAIEDVDRIEVTRGPNSAAYGPNSMLGIVNIITKHPSDVERGLVVVGIGSNGTLRATARAGAVFGNTAVRLTLNREQNAGYDLLSRTGDDHDSMRLDRLSVRTQTAIDPSTTLDIDFGYAGGLKEVAFADQFQVSYPDAKVQDTYVAATLSKALTPNHQLQVRGAFWSNRVRQEWATCIPTALFLPEMFRLWQANPAYASALAAGRVPSGGSATDDALAAAAAAAIAQLGPRAVQPACGGGNQNLTESRVALELQDTYVFSNKLRAVGGLGVRAQRGESATYLGGSVSNSIWWAFANAEYKPRPWLSLNAGGYVERDALSDRTTFSPRLAGNIRLSDTQAFRVVWSTGTRTPDIQEQRANWTYTSDASSPPLSASGLPLTRFYQSARSPGGLSSERITSREVGYLLNVPRIGLLLDTKVFDDRLSDLISEKLQLTDFHPTNNGHVRLSGAEVQANVELSSAWSGFLNYTYLVNSETSNLTERTQYSRHSGSAGVSHRFGDGWTVSAAYYGASGDGIGQSHFGRTDLTVSKGLRVAGSRVTASLSLRRLDNPSTTYFRDFDSILESRYNSRLQAFGSVRVSF